MIVNDPGVLAEVERAFAAYEQALMDNDLDTLDALFWHSPLTVRIGPGQNLYGIPGKKSADRDEYLAAMAVIGPGEVLTVYSGNSAPMRLKYDELKNFQDKKGQRRQRFSRAYKQIDRLEVNAAQP